MCWVESKICRKGRTKVNIWLSCRNLHQQVTFFSTVYLWACTGAGHRYPLYGVISLAREEVLINQTAEGKIGDSRHPARADEGPTSLQSRFLPPPAPTGITFTPPHSQYRVASIFFPQTIFCLFLADRKHSFQPVKVRSGQLHQPDFRTNFRLSSIKVTGLNNSGCGGCRQDSSQQQISCQSFPTSGRAGHRYWISPARDGLPEEKDNFLIKTGDAGFSSKPESGFSLNLQWAALPPLLAFCWNFFYCWNFFLPKTDLPFSRLSSCNGSSMFCWQYCCNKHNMMWHHRKVKRRIFGRNQQC